MELLNEPIEEVSVKTLSVLVADDDPPTRALLKAGIARWGYHVIEATDGEAAWEILQKSNAPDLIILDWMMPKLDGIGLCQRIQEKLSHKPYIILLTQIAGTQNIIKGLEAGADEFLSKPFNMAELRSRLSVGAKIIISQKKMKNYVERVNKLILDMSHISLQISAMLEKSNSSLEVKDLLVNLQQITDLNSALKGVIQLLSNFNLSQE
jgi:DNA-binding response OmpR family regulator